MQHKDIRQWRTSLISIHLGSARIDCCARSAAMSASLEPFLTASSASARSISSIPSSTAGAGVAPALPPFFFFLLLDLAGTAGDASAGEGESRQAAVESGAGVAAAAVFFFFLRFGFLDYYRELSVQRAEYIRRPPRTFAGAETASSFSDADSASSGSSPKSSW